MTIEVTVPACKLREPSNDNAISNLEEGTKVIVNKGGIAFLVLEPIEFGVDHGA